MALRYWKTLFTSSLLGVCGLAVWASQGEESKLPPPPTVAPTVSVELPPAVEPPPSPEPVRVVDSAPASRVPVVAVADAPPAPVVELPKPPTLPVAPPVVPPQVIMARVEKSEPADEPPPIPKAALELPPPLPSASVVAAPPAVVEPPVPPPTVTVPATPPPAATVAVPTPKAQPAHELGRPAAPTPANDTGTYKLHVRMGGNLGPRFEVRAGEHLLLKVYCDHIDLHGRQEGASILPGLTATGNVRFSGSGLNGTCDSLAIDAVDGMVRLKGQVKLTCYRGNASSQVTADALSFQLKGAQEVPTRFRPEGN